MTPHELALFEAAADCIIPPGFELPSAAEAGVVGYLERRSKEPSFEPLADRLREGFSLLNALTEDELGCTFDQAPSIHRPAVLRRLLALPVTPATLFFETLVRLTLTGYLCDPTHGGNRDAVAWRALGIDIARWPGAPSP